MKIRKILAVISTLLIGAGGATGGMILTDREASVPPRTPLETVQLFAENVKSLNFGAACDLAAFENFTSEECARGIMGVAAFGFLPIFNVPDQSATYKDHHPQIVMYLDSQKFHATLSSVDGEWIITNIN